MHTDKKMINADTANAKSEEYKYQDLTGLILKSAFEVHNTLIHKAQTLNYLKASGYEVALILNFAKPRLEYKKERRMSKIRQAVSFLTQPEAVYV